MSELALRWGEVGAAERLHARTWILGWWAAGRGLVLATVAIVHFAGPHGWTRHEQHAHLFGLLGSWDGRWYSLVAAHGYLLEPGRQSDPAFFPFFPLLLRGLHGLGVGYAAAGLLTSNLALLGALVAFEALTRALFGPRFARRATLYLAIFPLGYVFSMSYPESLVLLAVSLATVAALKGRWIATAALLAVGTLARPETLFVALPLLPLALRAPRPRERGLALGAILAPLAALASFALYLGLTLHDPLAWTHAERAWGRRFTPLGIVRAVQELPRTFTGNAWVVRDVICFVVYLGLLAAASRAGAPRLWILAGAIVVVVPTFSGSFHSIGRFGLLAPAVFWGLAALGESRRTDLVLRTACIALLIAGVVTIPYVFP